MIDISIVSPCSAQDVPEQPNSLENACSHIDIQATDAQVRLAAARARRERDVLLRTTPATIEHIRQLIALECTRVDRTPDAVSVPTNGPCAKACGSKICDMFGCMLDDHAPSGGVA